MLEELLIGNLWLALLLWVGIYVSDYYLTIYAAQLYRQAASEHIVFEGSLELTPVFQRDIDALRLVSRPFILRVLLSIILISLIWLLIVSMGYFRPLFGFLMGALILREAAVHMRHLRNIVLFRAVRDNGLLQGRIAYTRKLVLRLSGAELLSFAGLFLLGWLVSGSWFIFGGAFSCAITGMQHVRMAARVASAPAASAAVRS